MISFKTSQKWIIGLYALTVLLVSNLACLAASPSKITVYNQTENYNVQANKLKVWYGKNQNPSSVTISDLIQPKKDPAEYSTKTGWIGYQSVKYPYDLDKIKTSSVTIRVWPQNADSSSGEEATLELADNVAFDFIKYPVQARVKKGQRNTVQPGGVDTEYEYFDWTVKVTPKK